MANKCYTIQSVLGRAAVKRVVEKGGAGGGHRRKQIEETREVYGKTMQALCDAFTIYRYSQYKTMRRFPQMCWTVLALE